MKTTKSIYKVIFLNQGKVYELYARRIYQGDFYAFVEAEELIFGEQSSMLVNPTEERLQGEFSGVRRTFIPIHSIVRIDEMEKEGISKIRASSEGTDNNISPFPGSLYPPSSHKPGDKGKE